MLPALHDRSLEDWEEVLVPSLDTHDFQTLVLHGEAVAAPVEQSELALAVYLAWHQASQRIFVGVYRYDAYYGFRLPPEPPPVQSSFPEDVEECCFYYDHLRIVVDGDHGGEQCIAPGRVNPGPPQIETFRRIDNVECQDYLAVPEAEGERRIRTYGVGRLWAFEPPYTDAGGFREGESPSLSGYEVAVTPWDELQEDPALSARSMLEPWQIVGLCLEITATDNFVDWDRYLVTGGLPIRVRLFLDHATDRGMLVRLSALPTWIDLDGLMMSEADGVSSVPLL